MALHPDIRDFLKVMERLEQRPSMFILGCWSFAHLITFISAYELRDHGCMGYTPHDRAFRVQPLAIFLAEFNTYCHGVTGLAHYSYLDIKTGSDAEALSIFFGKLREFTEIAIKEGSYDE